MAFFMSAIRLEVEIMKGSKFYSHSTWACDLISPHVSLSGPRIGLVTL
jgi:hypothetical protein